MSPPNPCPRNETLKVVNLKVRDSCYIEGSQPSPYRRKLGGRLCFPGGRREREGEREGDVCVFMCSGSVAHIWGQMHPLA
jgi:hypothetical protein